MTKETTLAVPLFIKERRKKLNLSQERLAELAGLSTAMISNMETGRHGFSDKTLAAIAEALKCRPADLLIPMGAENKVSGENAVKDLLRRIDGLPEEAVSLVWRVIHGYLQDAE
ncbi:helix-turn-helix transcriptional regulator [Rhizobium leguminosarum bv. viciae 248]|uniref:helix-turn-helix domain-containing protein n=1 Tax=Rhizobium leguminosarum TaxID=384 RepID=UPI000365A581|nr:helix-turn-helix transcriptional regulator [Rhizobium leguminosarum]QHW26624.1 helix-turn-helix transcriptional regulator [Rhizobium leguminosarum bv. viciae 248]